MTVNNHLLSTQEYCLDVIGKRVSSLGMNKNYYFWEEDSVQWNRPFHFQTHVIGTEVLAPPLSLIPC